MTKKPPQGAARTKSGYIHNVCSDRKDVDPKDLDADDDEREDDEREGELRERLRERNVEGFEELPEDEQEAVVEAAEHNPDPTTRREAIEQELMELGRSDAGRELGS